jgi:hypothetical protein
VRLDPTLTVEVHTDGILGRARLVEDLEFTRRLLAPGLASGEGPGIGD